MWLNSPPVLAMRLSEKLFGWPRQIHTAPFHSTQRHLNHLTHQDATISFSIEQGPSNRNGIALIRLLAENTGVCAPLFPTTSGIGTLA